MEAVRFLLEMPDIFPGPDECRVPDIRVLPLVVDGPSSRVNVISKNLKNLAPSLFLNGDIPRVAGTGGM